MKVLATYSIKGGVGKTTAAVNLGHEAALAGARVLVWDLDPQGAATFFFRVEPKVKGGTKRLVGKRSDLTPHVRATDTIGLHLLPADFSLRHLDLHLDATKRPTERLTSLLATVSDRYDVAVLDCPPSISLASESVFGAADALLVPVIPTTLSWRTLAQLTQFLHGHPKGPAVLPFLSMVDRRRRLHRELTEELRSGWPCFLATAVPSSSVIERMGTERSALAVYAPSNPAARAFHDLWSEIAGRLWR